MDNHLAIQVQGLHKRFGEIQAVRGVSFDVAVGEIFSLLGPNGAGKSTTISMLSCLLEPSSGDAQVMGHSVRREPMAVRAAIGAVDCRPSPTCPPAGAARADAGVRRRWSAPCAHMS